ncbi:MAG: SDR family oxidoreductase [Alphaproteobacteria bacterium]|nr:SDR family oxidoreductase [Alphaproteobacteria bacterium]
MKAKSLEGRSVIVTGGGTGIGAACAVLAAAEGARVTICGRTRKTLENTAARIADAGGAAHIVTGDVTSEQYVERIIAEAVEFGSGLHGLVANAGGGGMLAPWHLQDQDNFIRVLHLNVLSTMLCVKHSVKHMAAAGGGSFVGMSSIAGHVTHPFFGAYTVGKAGIESMMRNAADEYGRAKVRFNGIQPGFITTEIMEGLSKGGPIYDSYVTQTPMHGVGEPKDIAMCARFLLSDESRWITGQMIAVDGGNFLRRGPDYSDSISRLHAPEDVLPARL